MACGPHSCTTQHGAIPYVLLWLCALVASVFFHFGHLHMFRWYICITPKMHLFKQVIYGGPSFVPQHYQISSAHYMPLGKSL